MRKVAVWISICAVWWGVISGWAGDIRGIVTDPSGRPVHNAIVLIYAAHPRVGPGYRCPGCYPDCRKRARTDAAGRFRIADVDPNLLFDLGALSPGYQPVWISKVDPAAGPIRISLKDRPRSYPPRSTILGRVVDEEGKPIPYALVTTKIYKATSRSYGPAPDGATTFAVTDSKGNFMLGSPESFYSMVLRIDAPGFARGIFEVKPEKRRKTLVLTEGVCIHGRLLFYGRPLGGIELGLCSQNQEPETFTGEFVTTTDEKGFFLFSYIPATNSYYLYTKMASMNLRGLFPQTPTLLLGGLSAPSLPISGYGYLPIQQVRTHSPGEWIELGDLHTVPGVELAGRVVFSDGKPIPPHTKLTVSRDEVWDSFSVELPSDGRFRITNLPTNEIFRVSVNLRRYHLSLRNGSLFLAFPYYLTGRLFQSKTNMIILLEPGPPPSINPPSNIPWDDHPVNLPLRGIEEPGYPTDWIVSGTVLDAETGQPIKRFRVLPAKVKKVHNYSTGKEELVDVWFPNREVIGTNGHFTVRMPFQAQQGRLAVTAEGYLPVTSSILPHGQTNWTCRLRRGTGPSGRILTPDGQPAAQVSVAYVLDSASLRLDASGRILVSTPLEEIRLTDEEGRFVFPPLFGKRFLIATGPEGFLILPAKKVGTNATLRLQRWAQITGRILCEGRPATNEVVLIEPHLAVSINLEIPKACTDSNGRFLCPHVPPGKVLLMKRISNYKFHPLPSNPSAIVYGSYRTLSLKPGQTIDVGDIPVLPQEKE